MHNTWEICSGTNTARQWCYCISLNLTYYPYMDYGPNQGFNLRPLDHDYILQGLMSQLQQIISYTAQKSQ